MNVFELFATLGLDTSGYDEGLQGAQSAGESFASSLTNGFSTACRVVDMPSLWVLSMLSP